MCLDDIGSLVFGNKKEWIEMKKETRRDFVKKAAYVAPILMTLAANPSLARAGSGDDTIGHGGVLRTDPKGQ